jgi:hypothetical protein
MASGPQHACHFLQSISLIHRRDVLDDGDSRHEIENSIIERETLSTPNYKLAVHSTGGRVSQHPLGGIHSHRHHISLQITT